MQNHMHVVSEERNLRTERLIFHKCLIYRRLRIIPLAMDIHQESLPISPLSLSNELTA